MSRRRRYCEGSRQQVPVRLPLRRYLSKSSQGWRPAGGCLYHVPVYAWHCAGDRSSPNAVQLMGVEPMTQGPFPECFVAERSGGSKATTATFSTANTIGNGRDSDSAHRAGQAQLVEGVMRSDSGAVIMPVARRLFRPCGLRGLAQGAAFASKTPLARGSSEVDRGRRRAFGASSRPGRSLVL